MLWKTKRSFIWNKRNIWKFCLKVEEHCSKLHWNWKCCHIHWAINKFRLSDLSRMNQCCSSLCAPRDCRITNIQRPIGSSPSVPESRILQIYGRLVVVGYINFDWLDLLFQRWNPFFKIRICSKVIAFPRWGFFRLNSCEFVHTKQVIDNLIYLNTWTVKPYGGLKKICPG